MLPPHDSAFGFDNIAETLGASPALVDQYLRAQAFLLQPYQCRRCFVRLYGFVSRRVPKSGTQSDLDETLRSQDILRGLAKKS